MKLLKKGLENFNFQKKSLLLVILLVIFLATSDIAKAQFEGIRFGANVWGGFGSDADMKKVAEFYDMLVFGKDAYTWVEKSRNWNPDAIILNYKVIMCNEVDFASGSCRDYSKFKDEWLLYRNGEKVCDTYWKPGDRLYNKECYMDISNPEIRQYMIDGYLDFFEEYPEFDGLWIDLAPSSLYYYGGATDKIRTDQEAFDSYKAYIMEVDDALDDIGKIFVPEWSRMSKEGNWDDLILEVDGAWDEAFYWGWRGSKKSDSEIQQQIEDCKFTIEHDRIYGAGIWAWDNPVSDFQDMTQEAYDKLKECGDHHIFLFYPQDTYKLEGALRGVDILSNLDTGEIPPPSECGDGNCDSGETCSSCPQDCSCLTLGTNLALNAVVTTSNEYYEPATFMVDGLWDEYEKYWAGTGSPNWVKVDLGQDYLINRIKSGPFGRSSTYYYDGEWNIKYSTASSPNTWNDFTSVVKVSGAGDLSGSGISIINGDPGIQTSNDNYKYYEFTFNEVNARYILFTVTVGDRDGDSNGDEIGVYGSESDCAPGDMPICNGIVDLFDLIFVINRFGTTPSDSNWDSAADVADPKNIIDIFDVVFVASRMS